VLLLFARPKIAADAPFLPRITRLTFQFSIWLDLIGAAVIVVAADVEMLLVFVVAVVVSPP
jgi:hypothetical protein